MKKVFFLVSILLFHVVCIAHPMPGSVVNLYVMDRTIQGEAKIPITELETAIGKSLVFNDLKDPSVFAYFQQHIHAVSGGGKWATKIDSIGTIQTVDPIVGKYVEVDVHFELIPSVSDQLHQFEFRYDAVIHQVITHKILVFIQQDWFNGVHDESGSKQIGVIELDTRSGAFQPLQVSLHKGSWWKGFFSMVLLGVEHIQEGTDHMLFVLILLLPSMLIPVRKRWKEYGGARYAFRNVVKIITAFTIGHSITLFVGANQWLKLPQEPVELLIAISIMISAIHAYRPIFYEREVLVAGGFGLIHGLAFATVLAKMKLSTSMMLSSILGFNIGIELAQLLLVLFSFPIFMLLVKTPYYPQVRIIGAVISIGVSVALIVERSFFMF